MAAVVAQDQADDEALVVVGRPILSRGAALRGMDLVEPTYRLVAALLELACQALADLPRARLDLAPVSFGWISNRSAKRPSSPRKAAESDA